MRAAALLLALLAAGCVTRRVEPQTSAEAPDLGPNATLRIECDRAQVVIPARPGSGPEYKVAVGAPPFSLELGGIRLVTREMPPTVEEAGEDTSIIAEGGVRVIRTTGRQEIEEGPYQTVIYRNGKMLKR